MNESSSNNLQHSSIYRDQLLTKGDLEDFKEVLILEIRSLVSNATSQPAKQWLKSSEVRKMLGISPGTLQNLRINGSISFSKVGGLVFYKHDEIVKMLESKNNLKAVSNG